jgi:hypothetical protein
MELQFTECDPIRLIAMICQLVAIIGIIGFEIALILKDKDGVYALPLASVICLIIGVKIPESKLNDFLSIVLKR